MRLRFVCAGNEFQGNGKQVQNHDEVLGTTSVDSADSSSTQQPIGVIACSKVTSNIEQSSDTAEDMKAATHESVKSTEEGLSSSPHLMCC